MTINTVPQWFGRAVLGRCGAPFPMGTADFLAAGPGAAVDRLVALYPHLKVFFESCRYGTDGDALVIDQIPVRHNTSTEPGWYLALAEELAEALRRNSPQFTDDATVTIA
jgi:hypothetical protein